MRAMRPKRKRSNSMAVDPKALQSPPWILGINKARPTLIKRMMILISVCQGVTRLVKESLYMRLVGHSSNFLFG